MFCGGLAGTVQAIHPAAHVVWYYPMELAYIHLVWRVSWLAQGPLLHLLGNTGVPWVNPTSETGPSRCPGPPTSQRPYL